MNAISISFGLFIALFVILLLGKMRKLKPQVAWYGSQLRMCPSCGLVTSRLIACCLECSYRAGLSNPFKIPGASRS